MLHSSKDNTERAELISIMEQEVESAKTQNLPIIRAFEAISERTGLKVNTVRNYYYRYINSLVDSDNVAKDEKRTKPGRAIGKPFTEEEVYTLMTTMLRAQGQGKSVRGCANELSNGDTKLLIRYQNKYRNVIANKVGYVESLMEEMAREGETFYNPYTKEYIINGRTSSYDSYRSQEKFDKMFKETIESLGQIQDMTIRQLVKGIWDISGKLAEEGQKAALDRDYDRIESERDELKDKVIEYERRLDGERWKSARLFTLLRQLVTINKNFLSLSEEAKLSEIDNYMLALKSCMDIYKVTEDEYL